MLAGEATANAEEAPSSVQILAAVQPNKFEPAGAAVLKASCPTTQVEGSDAVTVAGSVTGSEEKSGFRT